jgi:hypothetical protein
MRCGGQAVLHAAGFPMSVCSEAGAVTLIHRSGPAAARAGPAGGLKHRCPALTVQVLPGHLAGLLRAACRRLRGGPRHGCVPRSWAVAEVVVAGGSVPLPLPGAGGAAAEADLMSDQAMM